MPRFIVLKKFSINDPLEGRTKKMFNLLCLYAACRENTLVWVKRTGLKFVMIFLALFFYDYLRMLMRFTVFLPALVPKFFKKFNQI